VKLLNGEELAEYIMERQIREVRALRQAWHVQPRLALVTSKDGPADAYADACKEYGADILVDVDVYQLGQNDAPAKIAELNTDPSVHGIVQQSQQATDEIVPAKDVNAQGADASSDPALPMAVFWLLAGYNVDLQQGKRVVLWGAHGPMERMLKQSDVAVTVIDSGAQDAEQQLLDADIIISLTDPSKAVAADMVKPDAVVVDAENVGSLAVCALLENVIRAARLTVEDHPTPA
jgi:methylenetetrahydrofolate dehydrogenase (NADP+)/methenyltetrahydrofolate cyclohydrolase